MLSFGKTKNQMGLDLGHKVDVAVIPIKISFVTLAECAGALS